MSKRASINENLDGPSRCKCCPNESSTCKRHSRTPSPSTSKVLINKPTSYSLSCWLDDDFNLSFQTAGSEEAPLSNTANDTKCKTVFYYNPPTCGYVSLRSESSCFDGCSGSNGGLFSQFIRSRVGGSREGCPKYTVDMPEIEMDNTLAFESRFESGNLMKAIKL